MGVSNTILDKAGELDVAELMAVKRHAAYTTAILGFISHFGELAQASAAHHERLDGRDYPRGLTAARYQSKTLTMMADTVGTAIDATCFTH